MATTPNRFNSNTPYEDILAFLNQNFDLIDDQDRTKITKNANVPQILSGYQKGGFGALDYGIKVSKVNTATGIPYDVTTAGNDQLAFSTAFNSLKITEFNHVTLPTTPAASSQSVTVFPTGTYTKPPMVIAYFSDTSLITNPSYQLPYTVFGSGGSMQFSLSHVAYMQDPVTPVVRFDAVNIPAGGGFLGGTITYYLFQDPVT